MQLFLGNELITLAIMNNYKKEILEKICYTDLVYERVNKKLNIEFSKDQIEEMIIAILRETDETEFQKTGKNIYITNNERNVRLTINFYTSRIITADKLNKKTTNRYIGFSKKVQLFHQKKARRRLVLWVGI